MRSFVVGICVLASGLFAVDVQAQRPRPAAAVVGKPIKVEGAIKSVKDNVITVSSGRDHTVLVMVAPTTSMSITGTADVSALTVGMNVEFTTDLNQKGEIQTPIKDLYLREATDTSVKPGILDPEDVTASKLIRTLPEGTHSYVVRAKVRTNKDGEVTVAVQGHPAIKLKLADDATINVIFHSPHLAAAGDGIYVDGKEIQPNQVVGNTVTVKLTMPYAPKKKGPPGKTPPSQSPFGTP